MAGTTGLACKEGVGRTGDGFTFVGQHYFHTTISMEGIEYRGNERTREACDNSIIMEGRLRQVSGGSYMF